MSDAPLPEPLANAVAVSGPHIDASADRSPDILPDHSRSDPTPPPPTTPPAAEPKFKFPQHHPYAFNSTPLRPGINQWLIAPKDGRARRLGLVDDTGMGTHFHQLGIQTFNARIPGLSPTPLDREKFFKPKVDKEGLSERAIGIQLTKTIKSVLQAAGKSGLRVLHTPYHKARGDHDKTSDTVNDIGIYLDTEAARRVTTITLEDAKKSKLTKGEFESGDFGRRSWHCMAALGEVKSLHNAECAFYMRPKTWKNTKCGSDRAEDDTEAADNNSEEPQPPPTADALHDNVDDPPDDLADDAASLDASADAVDGKPYIKEPSKGESGLGQLGDYMHNLTTHQHRLFSYGFYVQWRWARLLYFDRTGALVSEPFDWTETSSLLHDFVWKFAHMTHEQRGYDPTVQEASYAEIAEVIARAKDKSKSLPEGIRSYIQDAFLSKDKENDHSREDGLQWDLDEAPIYKLTVTPSDPCPEDMFPNSMPNPPQPEMDRQGTAERTFLVCSPHFVADSLIGRCTRGYIAFDTLAKRFCFLKDSWRPLVPGRARPEHLVYEHLHRRRVECITTLVCGGDVGGSRHQLTRTHDCFPEEKRPVPRVHYRIVTQEIGIPLTQFADFGELSRVFIDAITAHYMAWEDAGILHRDVSVGNILINPITKQGYLIDWDLSRLRSELENGPVEPDRTGTWQFRSALFLAFPRKPYRLSDDVESFIHTYRWLVLRFHKTDVAGLRSFVQQEYEQSAKTVVTGVHVGGQQKLRSFAAPTSPFQVTDNDALQALLEEFAQQCYMHYQMVDKNLMASLYSIPVQSVSSEKPRQPEVAPAARGPYVPGRPHVLDRIRRMEPALSTPSLPLQPAAPAGIDPCNVNGPLSTHNLLVTVFLKGVNISTLRADDQFRIRFSDEPLDLVLNVGSRGISSLSQSKTVDSRELRLAVASGSPSTSQHASVELDPSSASATSSSSAAGRKRRQDDDDETHADDAVQEADVDDGSPSTMAQVSKRQKKTRARA